MPFRLTLNAVLILGLGLVMGALSLYMAMRSYTRMLAVGLFVTGLACILCGLTDGFADVTPRGVAMRKVGVISFVIGLPILIYSPNVLSCLNSIISKTTLYFFLS